MPLASACGPFLPVADTIFGIHPDVPLRRFAAGNLGIIQPGYAKSYLVVAYRYLSGRPLTPAEQSSILNLWSQRLAGNSVADSEDSTGDATDAAAKYTKLRAKVLNDKTDWRTQFAYGISQDAFQNALTNLQWLIQQFGLHGSEVKDWLTVQDKVFNDAPVSEGDLPPIPADANPLVRQLRAYQLAAAEFYANDLEKAVASFEAIADDKMLPTTSAGARLRDVCLYMAARCTTNIALAANDQDKLEAADKFVVDTIAKDPHNSYGSDLDDLRDAIDYQSESPAESLERLTKVINTTRTDRFGNAVGDLTWLLHTYFDDHGNRVPPSADDKTPPAEVPVDKHDLTDWLMTLHEPDESWDSIGVADRKEIEAQQKERGTHALDRWRHTHSLPWFVAAVSLNNPLDKSNQDLLSAATKCSPQSKAFLTSQFFLIDALIHARRKTEADNLLIRALGTHHIPPSARNLFLCQRLMTSQSVKEFLNSIVQRPVAISDDWDMTQTPNDKDYPNHQSANEVIAYTQAADLNANLPQKYWLQWCEDTALSPPLRARVILAAWLRSKLLGQEANLDDRLVAAYPSLRKEMDNYKNAPDGPEKRFALACLIIENWGMTPYLAPGVSRNLCKINEWDGFYNNFWLPLAPDAKLRTDDLAFTESLRYLGATPMRDRLVSYSAPVLTSLLTSAEKKDLAAERLAIWNNHPSRFLGEPILARAKSHPRDPRVPEMLYHLVKLPRWSGRSAIATKYSKAAYLLLHKQYPKSDWAQKAECWY